MYEVVYIKTYRREEEEDLESGYDKTDSYIFDEGTKRFETKEEIREFINDLKEYQDKDENKEEYSSIDYQYIDRVNDDPLIVGLVVNNIKTSTKTDILTEYDDNDNEIEKEIELGVIEEETVWVSISEIILNPLSEEEIKGLL